MKKYFLFILLIFSFSFVLAQFEDISTYQGQYYLNETLQQGTFKFNFDVYDSLVGGNLVYSDSKIITTGQLGEWYVELQGVSAAANDPTKEYFMEISIADVVQTPRRKITQFNYLRKDIPEVIENDLRIDSVLNSTNEANFNRVIVQGKDVCLEDGTNCLEINLSSLDEKLNLTDQRYNDTAFVLSQGYLTKESDPEFALENKSIWEAINGARNLLLNDIPFSTEANKSFFWNDLGGFTNNWLIQNGNNLDFNETKLVSLIQTLEVDTQYTSLSNFTNDLNFLNVNDLSLGNLILNISGIRVSNKNVCLEDGTNCLTLQDKFDQLVCGNGQVIKKVSGSWACSDDLNTQVFVSGNYLAKEGNIITFNENKLIETVGQKNNIPVMFISTIDGSLKNSVRYIPLGTDVLASPYPWEASFIIGYDLVIDGVYWTSVYDTTRGDAEIMVMKSTGDKDSFYDTAFYFSMGSDKKGEFFGKQVTFSKGDLMAIKFNPNNVKGQIDDLSLTFVGHYV
ncbi:hypothetical protein GW932_05220 [archaeon]|nr:hypothetical protein [archaeon]